MANEKIVLVDDEVEMLQLLKIELEGENYRVSMAHDGEAALDLIKAVHPDLVLLDVMIAGLDGFEVLERLRQSETTRDIPVVMVTAKGLEQDIQRGLKLGADDYIVKPFSPSLLLKRIRLILNGGKSHEQENPDRRG